MKNVITLLLGLCSFGLFGQIDVQETNQLLSLGSQNTYMFEVSGADKKMAENIWKDFIKDMDGKVKENKKAKEYFSEKVRLTGVNKGVPVDVYMKIDERKDMVVVYVAADRGDAFISSNDTPEDAKAMKSVVNNYGVKLLRKAIEEEMKDQEDELKDLKKDLSKLEDKNKDYHNDIKKAEEKIREANENIERNIDEQAQKQAQIDAQMKIVEAIIERYNNVGKEI